MWWPCPYVEEGEESGIPLFLVAPICARRVQSHSVTLAVSHQLLMGDFTAPPSPNLGQWELLDEVYAVHLQVLLEEVVGLGAEADGITFLGYRPSGVVGAVVPIMGGAIRILDYHEGITTFDSDFLQHISEGVEKLSA